MAHGRSNAEVATGVFVVGPSDDEQLQDELRVHDRCALPDPISVMVSVLLRKCYERDLGRVKLATRN